MDERSKAEKLSKGEWKILHAVWYLGNIMHELEGDCGDCCCNSWAEQLHIGDAMTVLKNIWYGRPPLEGLDDVCDEFAEEDDFDDEFYLEGDPIE